MSKASWGMHSPNLICICVDTKTRGEYAGRLWHQYEDRSVSYLGMTDLVRKMDALYDEWNFPQSSTRNRSFMNPPEQGQRTNRKEVQKKMDTSRIQDKHGDMGTFLVHVKYRQNSTWQGEVLWAEKKKRQYFRSALELIKLMDSALDETEAMQEEGSS